MAATVSTVPAVLDELVRRWSVAIPDAVVSDGPPANLEPDMIMVGFTGGVGEAAVTSTRTREQMATDPDREQYEITCVVSSWRGVDDDAAAVKTTRDRAYALVDAMAADLARDQTLGGLVLRARLSADSLATYYTDNGVSVDVQVTVAVDAFTRRL